MIADKGYYEKLVNDAFLNVVKSVLGDMQSGALDPVPALYLAFKTKFSGVKIPEILLQKFPDQMTIVLQYQYENLEISEKYFEVTLSFSGKKERLHIPFSALTSFHDTEATFSLVFNAKEEEKKDVPKASKIISLSDIKKGKKK